MNNTDHAQSAYPSKPASRSLSLWLLAGLLLLTLASWFGVDLSQINTHISHAGATLIVAVLAYRRVKHATGITFFASQAQARSAPPVQPVHRSSRRLPALVACAAIAVTLPQFVACSSLSPNAATGGAAALISGPVAQLAARAAGQAVAARYPQVSEAAPVIAALLRELVADDPASIQTACADCLAKHISDPIARAAAYDAIDGVLQQIRASGALGSDTQLKTTVLLLSALADGFDGTEPDNK